MDIFGLDPQFYFGETTYSPGGSWGPQVQYNLHLVYLYTGELSVSVADNVFELGPNEAIIIPPGTVNFYRYSNRRKSRHGWCAVTKPKLGKAAKRALQRPPVVIKMTDAFRRIAQLGYDLRNASKPSDLRLRANLGMALYNSFLSNSNFLEESPVLMPKAVSEIQNLIDTRYAEHLTLSQMARAANMTGTHLIRLFSKHVGYSPVEYLWHIRMTQGIELLKSSGLRISEIADQTGFSSCYHFSRRIRTVFGMTPSKIRALYSNAVVLPPKKRP